MDSARLVCTRGRHTISYDIVASKRDISSSSQDSDNLAKWFCSVHSDIHREVLGKNDDVHPVALVKSGSGGTRLFDILGEISADSQDRFLEQIACRLDGSVVEYTACRAERRPNFSRKAHIHHRLPRNRPLVSIQEAVPPHDISGDVFKVMIDALHGLEAMHMVAGEVHGNLDLNTILCTAGGPQEDDVGIRGFLLDYEHSRSYGLAEFPGFALNRIMSDLPKKMGISLSDMMAALATFTHPPKSERGMEILPV
ncbi:hypothetical protein OE88DRAFT_1669209, partial [Heliocybe sulcata]